MNNQNPETPSGIPELKTHLGLHLTMLALGLAVLGMLIRQQLGTKVPSL